MDIELEDKLIKKYYRFLKPAVIGPKLEKNMGYILMARGIELNKLDKTTLGIINNTFNEQAQILETILPCNIGCDNGWYNLIDSTLAKIAEYTDKIHGKTNKEYAEYYKELINNEKNSKSLFSNVDYYTKKYKELMEQPNETLILMVEISDIRQKFGGLDIRIKPCGFDLHASGYHLKGWSDSYINKIIINGEKESRKICEICGEKGELSKNKHEWIKTLCHNDRKKLEYKKIKAKEKSKN